MATICVRDTDIALGKIGVQMNEKEMARFIEHLWQMDKTRINSTATYELDLHDVLHDASPEMVEAPSPLFRRFNRTLLLRTVETIPAFITLLDNYHGPTGVREMVTSEEVHEIEEFLDKIMETPVMQETWKFLQRKVLPLNSPEEFRQLIRMLWFKTYKRKRSGDSSAFEHVFVGERKGSKVSGFHNWIRFAQLEAIKALAYRGHFRESCRSPTRMATISFRMRDGSVKSKTSMLFGTTPEFELALYTVVFLSNLRRVRFRMESCKMKVICHPMSKKAVLGTCYVTSKTPRKSKNLQANKSVFQIL
ncbi:poly(U)-specific endoribonuclease [Paragonimus westermani]|uniref:Uridylate-specific endoribonuclease n=1 Tax=Paragonimus westermani TaxID=34504 RepID=A0A5J4NI12_9TREM|nr:poly(U)-specific endoribonuclease [Paragonimus westermani]